MAGGMMNQVTGLIPGMKKEEEVPDVAPQEGEYQEYAVITKMIKYKLPSRPPRFNPLQNNSFCFISHKRENSSSSTR